MTHPGRAIFLGLIVLMSVFAGLSLGEAHLPIITLWRSVFTGDGIGALVIGTFRAPRVATAAGAGAVLGMSGMIFQTLFRNPLASPDILGFNAGAGVMVVGATILGLLIPMPVIAAIGGLAAAMVTAGVASRRGHDTPPLTLILVGLGIGFLCSALTTFLMTMIPTNQAAEAQRWLIGSLAARTWTNVSQVWGIGIVLALLALMQMRKLGALELGQSMAQGLGVNVPTARRALVITGVLLAATGVAVVGPIPFIALMAAPLAVSMTRAHTLAGRLLAAGAVGAAMLILSDLIARAALPGMQLPAGVVTGLLGAPYLLIRLSQEMKRGTL